MHKTFHCKACSQENMSSKGLVRNRKLRNLRSIQYILSILGFVSRNHIWVNQPNAIIANWQNWPSHNQLLYTLCWRMLTNGNKKHGTFEKETNELKIVNPCPALSWHRGFSEVLICILFLFIRLIHLGASDYPTLVVSAIKSIGLTPVESPAHHTMFWC